MVIAAGLSERRGLCPQGTAARLRSLLQALELPYEVPHRVPTAVLVEAMGLDKKARAGGLRLILLQQPGEAVIDDRSSDREIIDAIDACRPTSRAF
jgi:3-dehydroquinate synthase